jgi:cell division protein FtsZ
MSSKTKEQKKKPQKTDNLLKPRKIRVRVVGIGGGAASILSEMAKPLKGISFLIVDTDTRSFKRIPRNIKTFHFGKELTKGWGTGMNPEIGEKAAAKEKDKIKKYFQGFDLIILLSCLGGGVGSGASPIFSQALRESKILSLGIFTLPFSFEGEKKLRVAKKSLKSLKGDLSGIVILSNEEILGFSDKKISLKKSLSLMNQVLIDYFKDLMSIISTPGIINIDLADLKTILKGRNQICFFGRGVSKGNNRVEKSLEEVFESHFFKKPPKIKKILFNITGGKELNLKEVEEISSAVSKLNGRAKIIFGISKDKKLRNKIKITLLAVGDDSFEKEEVNGEKEKLVSSKKEKNKNQKEKKNKKEVQKSKRGRKKPKARRSAIEIKKSEKEEEEKEWWQESDWEIPAFLRKKSK